MLLPRTEIAARAAKFAQDWKEAKYEKGETHSFYNAFFDVFGRRRRDVAVYEEKVKKLDNRQGFIDLFWPGKLIVEQKSAGRSLIDAKAQVTDYFLALKEHEKPRYVLLSDFQRFEFWDLETNLEYAFALAELPNFLGLFDFIAGYEYTQYKDQDPVNITASELMSALHQQLENNRYTGKDLERLLVRIMFCLFAEDTGIFEPFSFLEMVEQTKPDGTDLGSRLSYLFEILDTPESQRQLSLEESLAQFPYVNGGLFEGGIKQPAFNAAMRQALLDCCYFNWAKVSPALFGSLFQTVMLPAEQRQGGAHYTSERNILKTIHPLFMDDLRAELATIIADKSSRRTNRLRDFQKQLGTLRFFDPACGCGNFLILAYRELRELEIALLEALYPAEGRTGVLDVKALSVVDVDQFYGIEIEEFAVRIAQTALWLVDHQMNVRLSASFGQAFSRLPLDKSPTIVCANALTTDWTTILPPSMCSYILGNPPFVGKHYRTDSQTADIARIFTDSKTSGLLDYVTCWFYKAAAYIKGTTLSVAFVSTNSIVQGEQVSALWPILLHKFNVSIQFAHQTFKWGIDEKKAKGMKVAAVYCAIIGFSSYETGKKKRLFTYDNNTGDPIEVTAQNINPYLVDGINVIVEARSTPICPVSSMVNGSKPADGGYLLLNESELEALLTEEPLVKSYIKPFIGAEEFINNKKRYCIWLKDVPPTEWRKLPLITKRVEAVKAFRLKSTDKQTQNDATTPYLFQKIRQPESDFVLVPSVSSEKREYVPIGFYSKDTIVSNLVFTLPNATLYHFGILTSRMHMAWMRYVCGRLEARYRYSNTIVYNNFPWPEASEAQQAAIGALAQQVLDARALYPEASLADLYDPLAMPVELRKAHQALDKAVDKLYRKEAFADDAARVALLFERYQQLTAGLLAGLLEKGKKKRKG
jgi:type II restriction/modification system DNA methylase subunit YeeA